MQDTIPREDRAQMINKMREFNGKGEPENAAKIQVAMDAGIFDLGEPDVIVEEVEVPDATGSKAKWVEYALKVSNIDPEVIEAQTKKDLINMLRANGLL